MEIFNQEKLEKYGNVLHSWSFKEFEEYRRNFIWYGIFLGIIILIAIYCIVNKNFLFLVIIVMFATLEVMFKFKKPNIIDFGIYEAGIRINDNMFFGEEIKEYYIIYDIDRGVKKIYFLLKKITQSSICIELERQNPTEVRESLNKYIKENTERKYEHFSDHITNILKL